MQNLILHRHLFRTQLSHWHLHRHPELIHRHPELDSGSSAEMLNQVQDDAVKRGLICKI